MDAERFFEIAVPYYIARSQLVFLSSKGRIHFSIGGEGSWTLVLGDIEQPIARGLVGEADLSIWFSAPAFKSFLAGTLDPRPAIRAGEFKAQGNVQLLQWLGLLLATPKSGFRVRMGLA
jgi:hypothetical protein